MSPLHNATGLSAELQCFRAHAGTLDKYPLDFRLTRVSQRVFGRPEAEMKLLRSARRQQGLYQLYAGFCDSETATCTRCPLVRLLDA